jgi:acetylornithine deacetylase/succinyl-diaminopimelate desuccinylase-like protein
MLAALDALKANAIEPTRNLRIILDGEEEAGSPNFEKAALAHAALLKGDVAIGIDGPRHPSGRPTMNFGDRGNVGALITVYGANHDLHSGNYGNWAPDPSMLLAHLLASMKDEHGRVQIAGFYDGVVPLTAAERKAIDEIPNVEPTLMQQFGFSRSEHPDSRLEYQHNLPTLTITGLESGTVRGQGRTIIAASASARLDMRLVVNLTPAQQFDRLVEHIRKQGYFLVDGDPDAKTRAAHPLLASVTRTGGTMPFRTLMDDPQAKKVSDALAQFGQVVRLPTIGATGPRGVLSDALHMPTVGISIVNFDNNQHGPNENVRIQNLWDGMEIIASVLTMAK